MLATVLSAFVVPFLTGLAKDFFATWLADRNAKALGAAQATVASQDLALASVQVANEVIAEAQMRQASDPTDAAFDQDFKRS